MEFQSSVVVETLRALEEQIGAFLRQAAQVAALFGAGQFASALEAADRQRHVLDLAVSMNARLHANVVPVDGLGGEVESVAELAIRARRMVAVTEIRRLRALLRDASVHGPIRGWFQGRFHTIDDVVAFLHTEFERINAMWAPYRRGASEDVIGSTERVSLYRQSMYLAERATRSLLDDPDLACLLNEGARATDWPEASMACRQIRAALGVQIELEHSLQSQYHQGDGEQVVRT